MKIYSAEGFESVKDFTLSQVSSLALMQEKLDWLSKESLAAGVYIRHPYDRLDGPIHESTVEGFDASIVSGLNRQFGITTKKQRDEAADQGAKLKPKS